MPKWSTCHNLNFRVDVKNYNWTPIKEAIDEAWGTYVEKGGRHRKGHYRLIHKIDFPVKQQVGDQCGFYVCHNMRLLYNEKVNTSAELEVCDLNCDVY